MKQIKRKPEYFNRMSENILKLTVLFSLVLIFFSCGTTKKLTVDGYKYKISKDFNRFLNQFENSVAKHNEENLILLMDSDYKIEQLNNFLNGNKEQFLKEFFCGSDTKTNVFVCPFFHEVFSVDLIRFSENNNDYYIVEYYINTTYERLKTNWTIKKNKTKRKIQFGFIGARG